MDDIINVFKVLSDETRIRIINLLLQKKLCVCEFTELLDLPQPKISKHIAKIRAANLVTTERNEQYIYYSINKSNVTSSKILSILNTLNIEQLEIDNQKLKAKTDFVCC